MLTSQEINDRRNARINGFLSEFEKATPPDPDTEDWTAWRAILADGRTDALVVPHRRCVLQATGVSEQSLARYWRSPHRARKTPGIYLLPTDARTTRIRTV